jgi:hypothetical protein
MPTNTVWQAPRLARLAPFLLLLGGCGAGAAELPPTQSAQITANGSGTSEGALAAGKRAYRFAQWPGKDGGVRPGVHVGRALADHIPGMKLGAVKEMAPADPRDPPSALELRWHSSIERGAYVRQRDHSSPRQAQEMLIGRLVHRTNPAVERRGVEMGIQIGDVSFPSGSCTLFVRNNIYLEVESRSGEAVEIAQLLDSALLGLPVKKTSEELAGYRPRIRSLCLAASPEQPLHVAGYAGRATRFPLSFDATDPEGGELSIFWRGAGGVSAKRSGGHPDAYEASIEVVGPEGVLREEFLGLTVVNERGMYAHAVLPIRFVVSKKARESVD